MNEGIEEVAKHDGFTIGTQKESVMKRLSLLSLLVFSFAVSAATSTWNIDGSHTAALFKVKHMVVSTVPGKITGATGKFEIDPKDFTKSTFTAELDPATINTGNVKRDDHLRNADFLDITNHPKITFVSKKITKTGSTYKVTGDFTLRGVAKSIELSNAELTAPIKDFSGAERRGFSAISSINRKDFGVNWNKTLDNGGLVASDKVDIEINVELISDQKPKAE